MRTQEIERERERAERRYYTLSFLFLRLRRYTFRSKDILRCQLYWPVNHLTVYVASQCRQTYPCMCIYICIYCLSVASPVELPLPHFNGHDRVLACSFYIHEFSWTKETFTSQSREACASLVRSVEKRRREREGESFGNSRSQPFNIQLLKIQRAQFKSLSVKNDTSGRLTIDIYHT